MLKLLNISFYLSLSLLFIISNCLNGQKSQNVELFGKFDRGDDRYSGCWIYNGPNAEYALLGTTSGTAIYSMDDSKNIKELAFIPGPHSNWREITVMGNHAYVVTEGKDPNPVGMQVIDLRSLPDTAKLVLNYTQEFNTGHMIQRDIYSNKPLLYVSGTNNTQGVHIIDVSNPKKPKQVGLYNPGYYIHDCFIKGTIMVAAAFNEGAYDVVFIDRPDRPFLLGQVFDPDGYCHSSWETEENGFLITCNERDGLRAKIWDIRKEPIISLASTYTSDPKGIVHNVYIKDSFAIFAHNTEGLRIVDILDPQTPVDVGFYDTYEGPVGGFHGLWSACPYSKSGKIIGGNREDGLYIWGFDTVFAGRIYGRIFNKKNQLHIFNAAVEIGDEPKPWRSDLQGRYRAGALPGTYNVKFTAVGYFDFDTTLTIAPKDSLMFDVFLEPYPVSTFTAEGYEISINPTLFNNTINILTKSQLQEGTIKIISSNGQIIHQQKYQHTISSSNINSGSYIIQIYNKNNQLILSKKIIKQ